MYHDPIVRTYGDKVFFIGHGDGLGPGDKKYKFLKAIFRSKVCQWLYARLHPNLGFTLARMASIKSRVATGSSDEIFLGEENEWLYLFCKEHLKQDLLSRKEMVLGLNEQ